MNSIISVVTPSYNQSNFIADTIKSILTQKGDFYIDYVIIDGKSTDGSQEVIKKYENELKANCKLENLHGLEFYVATKEFGLNRCKGISYRWLSEKDHGHGDALNKGFALTIGDVMCWLNSDDMYHEGAFQSVFEIFNQFEKVNWLTGLNSICDKAGSQIEVTYLGKQNYRNIFSFLTNDYEWIQQESTFWRKSLWIKAGSRINTDYKFMIDGELWCRFFLYEEIYHVNRELGRYRRHDTNRAHLYMSEVKSELGKAVRILEKNVSKHIRELAHSIANNTPLENRDFSEVNFKVIDKLASNSEWSISDIDFFRYSMKRSASKIRIFQHTITENARQNAITNKELMDQLKDRDSTIEKILNSKRYRLGKFLLNPVRLLAGTFSHIINSLNHVLNSLLSISPNKALKKLSYPVWLDWRLITTPDKYIIKSIKVKRDINLLLKRSINEVLKSQPNIPFSVHTDVLFVKSMIRPDYNDYFQKVFAQCNIPLKKMVDITYKDFTIRKKALVFKILWYFPVCLKVFNIKPKVWLYCYMKAILYLSVLKIMREYKFSTLVSFADMQGVENMLAQYFGKKRKKTITLQHGLYIDYTAYDNINIVNYKNVVSNYFLAWGRETKELIHKYHPNVKIEICGKPIYFNKPASKGDYFTLVFDQYLFINQNKELLLMSYEVARKHRTKVNVRLHPWDLKKRYEFNEYLTCYDMDLSGSSFVIGHTTSMIFECMRNGIPAFKYKTKYPSNSISDDLTFTNTQELMQRIESIDSYNFTELGKYYLEYVGDESLQQYAAFFKSLSNH